MAARESFFDFGANLRALLPCKAAWPLHWLKGIQLTVRTAAGSEKREDICEARADKFQSTNAMFFCKSCCTPL